MLYCDLAINGVPAWYGKPCLNQTALNWYNYQGFHGQLLFFDTQGTSDPAWAGLGTRYQLMYFDETGVANAVAVPLSAVPAQQVDVALGVNYTQYCTISIYDNEPT